jgi:pimeloyl-ACP methyl ester carboxylesterase
MVSAGKADDFVTTDTPYHPRKLSGFMRGAVCAATALTAFVVKPANAQLLSTPCRVPGLDEELRCVTLQVPENRAATGGRMIPLRIVILPSRAPATAPRQALFYLVSGPGLAASTFADLVANAHATTRSTHAIVLVDHRGTGGSSALDCTLYGDAGDIASYLGDQFPLDSVRGCGERLARAADLSRYTPADAADDLEDVRARLGISRIDLDASAYGTRVAMSYLRKYTDRVRSLVLQGVVSEKDPLPLTSARDAQRALDRLFADCAADPFCRTSFPALRRELNTLLARFDQGPLSVRVRHPRSMDSLTISLSRGVVADRLRLMLYSTRLSRRLPVVIHHAHEGDWTPFVTLAYELSRVVFDQLNAGAHLSAACAEYLMGAADTRDTFLGDYRARMYRQACAIWPVPSVPHDPGPLPIQVPMLLITGDLDPITPPRFAQALASRVPNATLMIVPRMAHAGSGRCVEEVIAQFIVRGAMQGVDSSCVSGIKPPPFITR